MNINPNALAGPQASQRREQDQEQGQLGRDDFMKLLVTQLQNQDPLDPMKSEQMVTQLSELTSVEELVAIEGRMQALEVGMGSLANTQVISLVGKTIVADGSSLRLSGDGPVESSLTLDAPAENVSVELKNAAGDVVRTLELGSGAMGPMNFTWDGLDDDGNELPPGRYEVTASATNADGQPVGVDTEMRGMVESVGYDDGYPELVVNGRRILLGDVRSVEN